MGEVESEIQVDVPVEKAYNQWTQFESFPRFMEGVQEVRQLDDRTMHWKARVGGKEQEWDAVITDQQPDRRIAWRSTTGAENAGDVQFEPAGNGTLVKLHLVFQPQGAMEVIGAAIGSLDRRVEGDLRRFKDFIEGSGQETGAWRGEIHESAPQGTDNPERGKEASPPD